MFCKNLKFLISRNLLKYSTSTSKTETIVTSLNNKNDSLEKSVKTKNVKKLEYTDVELDKILNILNHEDNSNLIELKIPLGQIKKFESWKTRKGLFKNFDDILDVDGVDVKNIAKICNVIIKDKPIRATNIKPLDSINKLLTPNLPSDITKKLTSVVGIYVGPSGISWAKLSCSNREIESWNFRNFSDLSPKTSSNENFLLALDILNDIPKGDIYILEALSGLGLQSQNQLGSVMAFIQQIELNSMLLTLLNTSDKHNKLINNDSTPRTIENSVYYIKSKLPARLFKTLVGTEKVSAINATEQLFHETDFNLSCDPIKINQQIKNKYKELLSINKELMSQALFVGIAFLDLCLFKNPVSLKAITPKRGKKDKNTVN